MAEEIAFNIIVPTRDRAETLVHCLRTIVIQDYENLNIIVCDNFSQDGTKDVVDSFADKRIKYINPGKRLSMSHNWEYALRHVTDGWVAIVGDDDGLLPNALATLAEAIKSTGCRGLISRRCTYFWPDSLSVDSRGVFVDNNLTVPLTTGIEFRNSRQWLGKLMRGEAFYYDLPMLYTGGVVHISSIDKARDRHGTFFLSMIPDVYSGIALASVLDEYVMLNEPVFVSGVSSKSNGASSLGTGQNLNAAKTFFSEPNISFHRNISGGELIKSIPILVYESYLQSVHLHKDFLKVTIEGQLAIALFSGSSENSADLREFCCKIASNNGLEISRVDSKVRRLKSELFFSRFVNMARRTMGELTVSGKDFGIQDIYGAVILARSTYVLNTRYAHWRIGNFFDSLKRVIRRMA